MTKKIILFLLILSFTLSMFACVGNGEPEITTDNPANSSDDEGDIPNPFDDGLGNPNLEKFELIFANYADNEHTFSFKMLDYDQDGDIVGDVIYERNLAVEQRFNCVITVKKFPSFVQTVQNAILANDTSNIFDVVMIYDAQINRLNLAGCLTTWDIMENCDLDKPWWNADANKCFVLDDKQFGAVGDFSLSTYSKAHLYYLNKDMYNTVDTGSDIYQLVRDGDWTIDKMLEIGALFSEDVNDNNIKDSGDKHGVVGTTKVHYQLILTGAGIKFIDTDDTGNPYFTLADNASVLEKMVKIVEKFGSTSCYYTNNPSPSGAIINDEFNNGNVLLLASTIWNVTDYRENSFKVGIIPAPKYDDNQTDYHTITVGGLISVIPRIITEDRAYNASIVLEGLSSYSAEHLVKAYTEDLLQARYGDAPDDWDMVGQLFDTLVFDFGVMVWAPEIRQPLMAQVFHVSSTNIASHIKQIQRSVDRIIKDTLNALD